MKKLKTHVEINSNNTGGSAVTNNLVLIASSFKYGIYARKDQSFWIPQESLPRKEPKWKI